MVRSPPRPVCAGCGRWPGWPAALVQWWKSALEAEDRRTTGLTAGLTAYATMNYINRRSLPLPFFTKLKLVDKTLQYMCIPHRQLSASSMSALTQLVNRWWVTSVSHKPLWLADCSVVPKPWVALKHSLVHFLNLSTQNSTTRWLTACKVQKGSHTFTEKTPRLIHDFLGPSECFSFSQPANI